MAKTLISSFNSNGQSTTAPSANPGPFAALFGMSDLAGSSLGIDSSAHFYTKNVNEIAQGIQLLKQPAGAGGATLANMDGGELQVDFNIPPGSPDAGTSGGITLWLNAVPGTQAGSGYGFFFDPRNSGSIAVGLMTNGCAQIFKTTAVTWNTWTNLRLILRGRPCGTGPAGNQYFHIHAEVQDLTNSFNVLQSMDCTVDGRYPWAVGTGALPVAGVAAISGFFAGFDQVSLYAFDSSGILAMVSDPICDWQSKTCLRITGQIPMGGSTPSYQHQYRVTGSGTWINVPTSGDMTGTSPSTVIQNLTPGTSYDTRRLTTDGTTNLTSTTLTVSTLAAGAGSYAAIYRGDSITIGANGPSQPFDRAQAQVAALNSASIQTPSHVLNLGIGGISAGQIASNAAKDVQLARELQADAIDLMIGTNDALSLETAATYQSVLAPYCSALNATPTRLVLHAPPYNNDTGNANFATFVNLLSVGYPASIVNLNGIYPNTYKGDTAFYGHSQTNQATYFDGVNVHPNVVGNAALGVDQAARLQVLFPGWYAPVVDAISFAAITLEVGMTRSIKVLATLSGSPATGVSLNGLVGNTAIATVSAGSEVTDGSGHATFSLSAASGATAGQSTTFTASNGTVNTAENINIVAIGGTGGGVASSIIQPNTYSFVE